MTTKAAELKAMNERILAELEDPGMQKHATDGMNDFTRMIMREQGFQRKILPSIGIGYGDCDQQVDTNKPVKVVEKEPDAPAAISIPLAKQPKNYYIQVPKYRVTGARIVTPRFTTDIAEISTLRMDVRQILSDNAIKDMLTEEDSQLLDAANSAMFGKDATSPLTGVVQWKTFYGGITVETLWAAKSVMATTPAHFSPTCALVNNVTINSVCMFSRNEFGGDLAEEIQRDGFTLTHYQGMDWVITIKRDLVPDNTIFYWADPKCIGKIYEFEPPTMAVKREAFMLDFYHYEMVGGAIGNVAGVCRADFE